MPMIGLTLQNPPNSCSSCFCFLFSCSLYGIFWNWQPPHFLSILHADLFFVCFPSFCFLFCILLFCPDCPAHFRAFRTAVAEAFFFGRSDDVFCSVSNNKDNSVLFKGIIWLFRFVFLYLFS